VQQQKNPHFDILKLKWCNTKPNKIFVDVGNVLSGEKDANDAEITHFTLIKLLSLP